MTEQKKESKEAPRAPSKETALRAVKGMNDILPPDSARWEWLEDTVRALLTPADLERHIETDGSLTLAEATLPAGRAIAGAVWGQGFPEPRFCDVLEVADQRVVGGKHLKLKVLREGRAFDAILFGACEPMPPRVEAVYRLDVNEFNGTAGLQLTLQHWREALAR